MVKELSKRIKFLKHLYLFTYVYSLCMYVLSCWPPEHQQQQLPAQYQIKFRLQFSRSHPMHDLKFSFNGHKLQEVEVMWNFVAFCCRIFQFENFARTKKKVLAREPQGGALVGGRGIDVYEFQPQTFFPGLCSLVGMSAYILAVCPGALQASVTACCCFSVLPHIY